MGLGQEERLALDSRFRLRPRLGDNRFSIEKSSVEGRRPAEAGTGTFHLDVGTGLERGKEPSTSLRFQDWNPDMKTARNMKVDIVYSSRTNEIRCPQLNFSSTSVRITGTSLSSRSSIPYVDGSGNSSRISSSSDSSSARQSDSARSSSGGSSRGSEGKDSVTKKD